MNNYPELPHNLKGAIPAKNLLNLMPRELVQELRAFIFEKTPNKSTVATGGAIAAPAFAYYYKKLLEVYPETKRSFDIPQGVFRGEYEGKSELYTSN